MEEIKLNTKISIFKTTLPSFPQQKLVEEAYCNSDIRDAPRQPQDQSPGFQSDVYIINGKLEECSKIINNILVTKFYPNSNFKFGFRNWIYISNRTTITSFYHSHTKMSQLKCEGNWTWTYYIQMPNQLKEEEGKLSFLVEKDKTFSILPKEGDLLIFPASLQHKPFETPNSTRDRIVLAGTIGKLDMNHRYTKDRQTLM